MSKTTITSDSGNITITGEKIAKLFNVIQAAEKAEEKWYNSKVETNEQGRPKSILLPLDKRLNPGKKKNEIPLELGKIFDEEILAKLPFDFSDKFDTSIEFRNFANGQKNNFMRQGMKKFGGKLVSYNYLNKVAAESGIKEKDKITQHLVREKVMSEMLDTVQKAFETYMKNHADILKPSAETLEQYRKVYSETIAKINEKIEKGDYSEYDHKNKKGDFVKGNEEDAKKHIENIHNKMAAIDKAIAATNAMDKKENAPMNPDIANADLDELKSNRPRNH